MTAFSRWGLYGLWTTRTHFDWYAYVRLSIHSFTFHLMLSLEITLMINCVLRCTMSLEPLFETGLIDDATSWSFRWKITTYLTKINFHSGDNLFLLATTIWFVWHYSVCLFLLFLWNTSPKTRLIWSKQGHMTGETARFQSLWYKKYERSTIERMKSSVLIRCIFIAVVP